MKQGNTTSILAAIATLEEINDGKARFRKALARLDTTQKQEYQKIWQYIDNCGTGFKETDEDKENAFYQAFGAKAYSPRKIFIMLRKIADWIDDFAIMDDAEQSGCLDLIRARYYNKKGKIEKRDKALSTSQEKAMKADELTKLHLLTLTYHDQYFLLDEGGIEAEHQDILIDLLSSTQTLSHALIFKAIIQRLTYFRSGSGEIPDNLRILVKLQLALLPKAPSTLVALQVLAIELLLNPSVETYKTLKAAFVKGTGKLGLEKYSLFKSLTNALVIFNLFKGKMMQEFLSLYEIAMDKKVFLENGRLLMITFNNVVLVFKSLGEYGLLEQFVKQHGGLIKDEKEKTHSIRFAECHLLFGDREYVAAMEKLKTVKSIDYTFTLGKMILKAKCLYEYHKNKDDAYIEIGDIKESFDRLVNRYYREGLFGIVSKKRYNNFFKLMANITNHKKSKMHIIELYESFEGQSFELKWLGEKIAELK